MLMRRMHSLLAGLCATTAFVFAQAPATVVSPALPKPIAAPARPLPPEADSARVTKFSFIAYGDTRSGGDPAVPGDGQVVQQEHFRLMDFLLARVDSLKDSAFPVRFVVQSGDAVLRGANAEMWNVSFTPIIERLTRRWDIPYFLAAGNHDVTGMPLGSEGREPGLRNTLAALSELIPPDGSPRRLNRYPTYAFGYGNLFAITMDSNIASDSTQLAWVAEQLDRLDRRRYRHVIAFFHHPVFSSGPHGGAHVEPSTQAIRDLYMPLFRRHHVGLLITGHDHLFDHWIERYQDRGKKYRMDQIVTGGGGAPLYAYDGEPDLSAYSAASRLTIEHLAKPGRTAAENPHHFVVIQVDGDRLSLEVVGSGADFAPYGGKSRIDLADSGS